MKIGKVKTSSLITWLIVVLIFSVFIGITGISMGLGSIYPQLNLVAKPFVCPSQQMSYAQNASEIGSDTYWNATWFCKDEQSDNKTEINPNTIFLFAGSIYGLLFFSVLLIITYLYWYSNFGPAKNDGLHLW